MIVVVKTVGIDEMSPRHPEILRLLIHLGDERGHRLLPVRAVILQDDTADVRRDGFRGVVSRGQEHRVQQILVADLQSGL